MAATIPDRYEPAPPPPPPPPPPRLPSYLPPPRPPARTDQSPSRGWLAGALLAAALLGGASGGLVAAAVSGQWRDTIGISGTTVPAAAGSLANAAALALPSVVSVKVVTPEETDEGSGVVITSGGLILTNNHVVALGATGATITVTLSSGKSASATLVGRSVENDVAVLQVSGIRGLKTAVLSTGRLVVGQQVLAIGNALGLSETVSSGIVSATNRDLTVSTGQSQFGQASTEQLTGTVQTDAAINPGNSGGALVDTSGRVIGLVTAAASLSDSASGSIGVGFAIPIGKAMAVARTLATGL